MNYLHGLISDWENKMSIPFHCFLFDASLFKKHNITFDEQLPNHEDWDCLMNIFRSGRSENTSILFLKTVSSISCL